MNILLLQLDGKLPNLALMRIGHWHLEQGHRVELRHAGNAKAVMDRMHRRAQIRAFGARPYPMPLHRTPELVGFQRWVIGAYDKRVPWDKWAGAKYSPRRLGNRSRGQQRLLPIYEGP